MKSSELFASVGRRGYGVLHRIAPTHVERYRVGRFAQQMVVPLDVYEGPTEYTSAVERSCPGIDLNEERQLELLAAWVDETVADFDGIRSDPDINLQGTAGYIENGFYATPDPEVYFRMIGRVRPRRIVEIGGGFSTLIARAAIKHYELATELVVVDPEPRTAVEAAADRVHRTRIEHHAEDDLIGEHDILFIDSSHVLRSGGDVPFLFLELIPKLPVGTVVHVHDIFTPYVYPSRFGAAMWTEQFVLEALLSGSPRYEVMWATYWMSRTHPEQMRRAFGPVIGTRPRQNGQSFWFGVTAPG